jgi:hypothetical protein
MQNASLKELYSSKFSYGNPCFLHQLRENRRSSIKEERPAYPLLIKIDEKKYQQSDFKIMIFGQETNSWERRQIKDFTPVENSHEIIENTIDLFMTQYLDYFSEKIEHKGIASPFWNTLKKTNKVLKQSKPNLYIIWNNIYKIGNISRNCNRPYESVRKFENLKFGNVIEEEINILKPDLLILFTGPQYEPRVKKILHIKDSKPLQESINVDELAYLNLEFGVRAYRTYHPNHLYRKKKTNYINLILNDVKKHIF